MPENQTEPRYRIELSESEVYIIRDALDLFSHLSLGHFYCAAELAPVAQKNPSAASSVRTLLQDLQSVFTGLSSNSASYSIMSEKIHPNALKACDLMQAFRHRLACDHRDRQDLETMDPTMFMGKPYFPPTYLSDFQVLPFIEQIPTSDTQL